MFSSLRFTFANLFKFVFHNSAWNSLHIIYLYNLKSVKIFKQITNWENSFQLKYHVFHKYHTSFHLVGGLKLQKQWKIINLLRGFSVSIQCLTLNSKNRWHNSFRRRVYFRKLPLTKTVPMIPEKCAIFMLWRIS